MRSRRIPSVILGLTAALLLAGCDDATGPAVDAGTGGAIDPGTGDVSLKSVDVPLPGGGHTRLDLLGRDLALEDDGEHVSLTVALRNAGAEPVRAPLVLWLHRFEPASVFAANPDTSLPVASILPVDGYVYAEEFGDGGVLAPGAVSAGRTWRFRTPDQGPFAFAVRAEAAGPPAGPVIAGVCFYDGDGDGVRDDGERPLYPGVVHVLAPDSSHTMLQVRPDGSYAYPLASAGLHEVGFLPGFETFVALRYTTPNPRHVLITPDADGAPRGFGGADFGAVTDVPPPPVRFSDLPADSLRRAPWHLLGVQAEGDVLALQAGFSGCGPDHPFALWVSGGFMESEPVQVRLVLEHDDRGELCDAAWTRDLRFDLTPLAAAYREAYGEGVLVLVLEDFAGGEHRLRWQVPAGPPR